MDYNRSAMSTPFISTKLQLPALRSGLVVRPRLLQQLNAGLAGKLTLISASTGFGKTTLASAWAQQCGRPVAWLALDELDNDPRRFVTYLIHAIQTVQQGFGVALLESLKTAPAPSISPAPGGWLEALIAEIAAYPNSFLLALDDYHLITNPAIQEMLTFLLTHQSPNLHLILISRADPPWALGRLRARREMNEIRTADLRFTTQEAAEFLNTCMGLNLTEQEIASLDQRTEGWIAGLQLAALSLQGQAHPQEIISSLAGTHRFIADYLIEEVLEKQTPEIQEFLLKTSILSQMNAALCDELTGRGDSQTTLMKLEQANLFLQSLDNERYWYRYHHLFADLLRIKLGQAHSTQIAVLHRHASQWFEKNKMIAEAIRHALAANDFMQAMSLVKGTAFSMLDSGELATLIGWLDSIPQDLINTQPWMSIFYAWALAYTDQLNRAEEYLLKAESALPDFSEPDNPQYKREYILGYIAAIRVLISKNRGEMSLAVGLANEALKYLPDQDYKTRCYVAQTLGDAHLFVGNLDAASQALQAAIEASQKIDDINRTVHVLCDLAGLQWMLGQLRASEASCLEALRLAENNLAGEKYASGAGIAHARLSRILLEGNDAESALRHVEQGLALSKQRGEADILFFCLVTLAEIQISNKDAQGAVTTLQKARPKPGSGAAWHAALLDQFEAEALFSQGNLVAAERWFQNLGWNIGDEMPEGQANAFEFVARILIAKHEYSAALDLLDSLLIQEQAKGVKAFVLLFLISQAIAWQARGEVDLALTALDQALAQAEPEGYVRTFTDRGAPIRGLLQKAVERGMHVQYAQRLLAVLNSAPDTTISSSKPDMAKIVEPFSDRELEVLRLLSTDLAAPEIADRLIISSNTVRTHIKSLYRKLNAHSRHEALAHAREWQLFQPTSLMTAIA